MELRELLNFIEFFSSLLDIVFLTQFLLSVKNNMGKTVRKRLVSLGILYFKLCFSILDGMNSHFKKRNESKKKLAFLLIF